MTGPHFLGGVHAKIGAPFAARPRSSAMGAGSAMPTTISMEIAKPLRVHPHDGDARQFGRIGAGRRPKAIDRTVAPGRR
jgi:hypothetical protein